MSLTKEQKKIILGMAKNIMHDAEAVINTECLDREYLLRQEYIIRAKNELDFSQRRLEAYLETLVGDE